MNKVSDVIAKFLKELDIKIVFGIIGSANSHIFDSITKLDRPVIVAYLMMTVLVFVTINLVVDLLYTWLDPRVRLAGETS
jgi:ABC-type dipeptide/oligopeptide/nickel transport system permease component